MLNGFYASWYLIVGTKTLLAISRRCNFSDFLRWRPIGWIEIGLSQADAAIHLNVSRNVVQTLRLIWIWKFSINKTYSRQPMGYNNPCARSLSSSFRPKEQKHSVTQLITDQLKATGKSAITVSRHLHNQRPYARWLVTCVPLNRRDRSGRLRSPRKHVTWTKQQWASVVFTDESRFALEGDPALVLI